MVNVNVFISAGEFDGNAYQTDYITPGGTNAQGFINYDDYGIRLSNFVSRHQFPNTITPTGYYTIRVKSRAFFIFEGITIPQGALISDATLTFGLLSEQTNTTIGTGTVFGRKTASPIPYTTTQTTAANSVFTKPVATAIGNFTWSGSPTTYEFTSKPVDVKDVVQELVNTFDYANDNMMFLLQTPPLTLPPTTATPTTTKSNIVTVDNYEEQSTGIPNLQINFEIVAQNCFPVSDISNTGAWEDVTFGNNDAALWNELDDPVGEIDGESSAVRSKTSPSISDTFEVKLQSDCFDPFASDIHIIRWTARGLGNQVKVQLFQGVTLIAESPTVVLTEFFVNRTYTLSAGEANSITDYSDLRIRVVPSVVP